MTTIANDEVEKFSKLSDKWWDLDGPLKTLHDINPTRLEWISHHLPNLKGLRALDVGCGGGILTESLTRLGALMTGIDASDESINVAKAHAEKGQLSIDYQSTAIEDFEAKAPFDAIFCLELLEHVPNYEAIIQHAKRLLKPGGLLFLSTINRTTKAYLGAILVAEYALGLLERQTHDYQKFLRPSELSRTLRAHQFDMVDLKGLSFNPISRSASLSESVDINYLMAASLHS